VEFGPARAVLKAPSHPYTMSLLSAVPVLTGPRRLLPALSDHMPGLGSFAGLPGCRFAPRCAVKDPACANTRLPPRRIGEGHWVRCAESCATGTIASIAPELPANAAAGDKASVDFRNVRLSYNASRGFLGLRRSRFDAVKSATFSIREGEILGIVGESGSGKTSIGRLIVGLEQPSAGSISIDGEDYVQDGRIIHLTRRDTQLIFQDPQSALNPRRSVLRLLTQALETGDSYKPEHARRPFAESLLKDIGLPPDCLDRFPSQLSGGQRQRVNIGRALGAKPKLVVADEIVSGLDVSVQAHILNCLLDLNRRHGLTMVFISHDLAVVRYLCSRILMMHAGEIVEEGETEAVFANPRHAYTKALLDAVPPDNTDQPWPPVLQ